MTTAEAILTRRSIRKFEQKPLERSLLKEIVNAGRLAPQAANVQPLKFAVADTKKVCARIFPSTKWAKLLGEKGQPKSGEEPVAYIMVLQNTKQKLNQEADAAFAIENMVLYAWENGVASCILGAIDREAIAKAINMPEGYELVYAVAFGYPMQESSFEDAEDSVKYYMDAEGRVHVPKRKLEDVMYFAEEESK